VIKRLNKYSWFTGKAIIKKRGDYHVVNAFCLSYMDFNLIMSKSFNAVTCTARICFGSIYQDNLDEMNHYKKTIRRCKNEKV